MIEKNIGNIERVVRLLMGLSLLAWALLQGALNPIEWFVIVVAASLILNGIFSRCYLWYLFEVDTRHKPSNSKPSSIC